MTESIHTENPAAVRCALYLRSATGDRASLLRQEEACRAAAAKHEPAWQIVEDRIFTDVGLSKTSRDKRPGLTALLKRAAENPKPFDYVLVESADRISRNLTESLSAVDLLAHHNIGLHIVSMDLDSRSPNFRNLLLCGMDYESRLIRYHGGKVSHAHNAALRQNRTVGGRCYGYRPVVVYEPSDGQPRVLGVKLTVQREEAEVVLDIFREFANGRSTERIARHLNDRGVPGPTGENWNGASVRRILRSSRYRGTVVWGRTSRVRNPQTGRIGSRPRPEHEFIEVIVPELRIVDDALAASVDARLGSFDPT